ncbi:hypothetical protein [Anoxynatronum sibiricum]
MDGKKLHQERLLLKCEVLEEAQSSKQPLNRETAGSRNWPAGLTVKKA